MSKVMFKPIDTKSTFTTVDKPKRIVYKEVLPFRVRFSTIGVPGVQGLIPPIGIAIVGVNNYIL